ncbi:hypothetical protein [Paraburkholderia tropica]|uniref:hypothetical protein n=1 Tax=Paraburkholderia tropica TaxID=92647 RepID=UPI0007EDEADA|nr:hypothetical protein [Paraburkholderia tropica]OBR53143.1 hypothetical protein A6456_09270 [Paraburkholderia tropica]
MTTSPAQISSGFVDTGLKLNHDLVNQLNEMTSGEHLASECWKSGRTMLVEGALWSIFGAALWVAVLYLMS